jgi:hypothetical protein
LHPRKLHHRQVREQPATSASAKPSIKLQHESKRPVTILTI